MYIRFERTFDQFGDLTGKRVLDIGCGSGIYALECCLRNALSVTGVDPAPNMISLAKRRAEEKGFADRCTWLAGAFPNIKLEAHDHVIVTGVMDYIEDSLLFLKNLRGLARESVAITFPSWHWLRTPVRQFRYRLRNCPVFAYREAEIMDLCKKAEFSSVKIYKIPGPGLDYHVALHP